MSLIPTEMQLIRDAIDTADLAELSVDERRNAQHLLDSWGARIRELAIAHAAGDEDAEQKARGCLVEICEGLADLAALLDVQQRRHTARAVTQILRVAGDVADRSVRYAADVAAASLARAALSAFAGSR